MKTYLLPILIVFISIMVLVNKGVVAQTKGHSPSFSDTLKPKTYSVNGNLDWWIKNANGLVILREQLKQSDLPSKNVSYLIDSIITPFQNEIAIQIQRQLPKDTTQKK